MLRLGQSLSPLPPAPITPLEISFFVWVGFCREGRARKVLGKSALDFWQGHASAPPHRPLRIPLSPSRLAPHRLMNQPGTFLTISGGVVPA